MTQYTKYKINYNELHRRKNYLQEVSVQRNAPIYHYTTVWNSLEKGIIPLIQAFETQMTTPIFSCEGHLNIKREPYVTFLVLPGQSVNFENYLYHIIEYIPEDYVHIRFYNKFRPRRYKNGPGPFIDWSIVIDMPFYKIKSNTDFAKYRDYEVLKHATYFQNKFKNCI